MTDSGPELGLQLAVNPEDWRDPGRVRGEADPTTLEARLPSPGSTPAAAENGGCRARRSRRSDDAWYDSPIDSVQLNQWIRVQANRKRKKGYDGPRGSITPREGGCGLCGHVYVPKRRSRLRDGKRGRRHGYCSNNRCPRALHRKGKAKHTFDGRSIWVSGSGTLFAGRSKCGLRGAMSLSEKNKIHRSGQ